MVTKKIKPGHLRQHGEIRAALTQALRTHGGSMFYTELKAAAGNRNIQTTLRRMVDAGYVQYQRIAPRVGVYRWNDGGVYPVWVDTPPQRTPAATPAPALTRWMPSSPYGAKK